MEPMIRVIKEYFSGAFAIKRKKINPNRIPISPKNYDLEKIREQELVKIRELTGVSLSLQ